MVSGAGYTIKCKLISKNRNRSQFSRMMEKTIFENTILKIIFPKNCVNLMTEATTNFRPTKAPMAFLVAKDRSGTTLLQTMLDSHPNICAPLESRFVLHLKNKYENKTRWNNAVKAKFIKDLFKEEKMVLLWELDLEALNRRLGNLPEITSYGEVCKQVYVSSKSFHTKGTAKLIVDKNPIYAIMIPFLQKIYPEAKFIHLIRDYHGNISSILNLHKDTSVKKLGLSWIMTNSEIEKSKQKSPENFITLRYEDLLDDPKNELERLVTFFNLEFHHNMLSYHERIANAISDYVDRSPNEKVRKVREIGIAKVHKNLSKPIDNSFKDKWKETMSKEEIQTLEKYCSKFGERYDYTRTTLVAQKEEAIPTSLLFERDKLRLYYELPIWLRELKSKPSMPFIPKQ